MKQATFSEWVKLRRPGMLAALICAMAVTTLGTIIAVVTAGQHSTGHKLASTVSLTHQQLISSSGLADAIGGASLLLGIITLGVVASSVAGEYSVGTLRNLLIREPHRRRLLGGKLLGLAAAIAVTVILSSLVAYAGGIVTALAKDVDISAWGSGSGILRLLAAEGELIGSTLAWGLFGALLGILFRSPVVAIGVGVAYFLPLESILGDINGLSRWLPGKLFSAIASGGNSTASLGAAAATVAVYSAIAVALSIRMFTQRDITS